MQRLAINDLALNPEAQVDLRVGFRARAFGRLPAVFADRNDILTVNPTTLAVEKRPELCELAELAQGPGAIGEAEAVAGVPRVIDDALSPWIPENSVLLSGNTVVGTHTHPILSTLRFEKGRNARTYVATLSPMRDFPPESLVGGQKSWPSARDCVAANRRPSAWEDDPRPSSSKGLRSVACRERQQAA